MFAQAAQRGPDDQDPARAGRDLRPGRAAEAAPAARDADHRIRRAAPTRPPPRSPPAGRRRRRHAARRIAAARRSAAARTAPPPPPGAPPRGWRARRCERRPPHAARRHAVRPDRPRRRRSPRRPARSGNGSASHDARGHRPPHAGAAARRWPSRCSCSRSSLVLVVVLGPIVLLHRHYNTAIADLTDRLERYRRVAAQAPELRRALDVMKEKDGRRFYLKNTAPNLASAELADLVRSAIENNGGRITTSQNPGPRDEGALPAAHGERAVLRDHADAGEDAERARHANALPRRRQSVDPAAQRVSRLQARCRAGAGKQRAARRIRARLSRAAARAGAASK